MKKVRNAHLVKTNPNKANFSTPKGVEKKTDKGGQKPALFGMLYIKALL